MRFEYKKRTGIYSSQDCYQSKHKIHLWGNDYTSTVPKYVDTIQLSMKQIIIRTFKLLNQCINNLYATTTEYNYKTKQKYIYVQCVSQN